MASRPRPPVTDLWLALDKFVELYGIIIDYGRRNYRYKHEWSLMRDRVRTRGAWTVTSAMNAPKPRKQRIKPFTYAATGLAGIGLAVSVGACGSTTTVTRTVPGPTVTATVQVAGPTVTETASAPPPATGTKLGSWSGSGNQVTPAFNAP